MHRFRTVGLALCTAAVAGVMLLAGCSGTGTATDPTIGPTSAPDMLASGHSTPATAQHTETSPRSVASQPTQQNTPAVQPTPETITVAVWWPDELYPPADSAALALLDRQLDSFRSTYSAYGLDVRRKRTNGLGGILPTLRTAAPVAPGALPDLTLMRRADMLTAATEGLIVPLDDWIPSDVADSNLIAGTRALGEINGVLYGVPYALNFFHVAYRASVFDQPLLTFDDVLLNEPHYLFPAGTTLLNWTVLLQYLEAGGHLVDANGAVMLEREPLVTVLDYYARGVDRGIFGTNLLEFTQYDDYWNQFVAAEVHMVGVDSLTYLSQQASVQNVGLAPIPTVDGLPVTALDGWMWVLTTQDPDRQQQARTFLSWMMRISQQSAFTEAFGVVPSQSRALRLWDDEVYADFAQTLLESALVIPGAQRSNSAAMALQQSLVAVLDGESPEVAADAALGKLAE